MIGSLQPLSVHIADDCIDIDLYDFASPLRCSTQIHIAMSVTGVVQYITDPEWVAHAAVHTLTGDYSCVHFSLSVCICM